MAELPAYLQESLNNTKAEYRRLGKSGLHISVPVLGAMSFGTPEWQSWVIDEEKVGRVVPGSGVDWITRHVFTDRST